MSVLHVDRAYPEARLGIAGQDHPPSLRRVSGDDQVVCPVRLTELTAADVQKALGVLATRQSSRTVQIAHNVLVLAIRQAERDDLVGRNVAALVKPPKGHLGGRPSSR